MTSLPRYERNLPALLEDLYLGPLPSYRNDLLAAVGRTRQRPAWSFPERWLPVDIANRLTFAPRYPVRVVAVALLVLALIIAGVVAYVGTHQPLKPAQPFGPARNGSLVFALEGDIYAGDSTSGTSHRIISGAEFDRKPLLSPDGMQVAFLRTSADSTTDAFDLMVANVDGSNVRMISTTKVGSADLGLWSPDGTYLLLTDGDGELVRYDTAAPAPAVVARHTLIHDFQPPRGGQLLFESTEGDRSLGLMNPDGSNAHYIYTIPAGETQDGCDFGTVLWSPDGARIAFMRHPVGTPYQCRVFVMNAHGTGAHQLTNNSGEWFETDFRWSPDSKQIAFDRWQGPNWRINPIGVVSADGGQARSLGPTPVADGAAFEWSPDGKSIISTPGTVTGWPPSTTLPEAHPTIIDVATGESHEAPWTMSSWPTWQRVGE